MAHAHTPLANLLCTLSDREPVSTHIDLTERGLTPLTKCYTERGSDEAKAFIEKNPLSLYQAGSKGTILDFAVGAIDVPFVDYLVVEKDLLTAYNNEQKTFLACKAINPFVSFTFNPPRAAKYNGLEQKGLIFNRLKETGLFSIAIAKNNEHLDAKRTTAEPATATHDVYFAAVALLNHIAKCNAGETKGNAVASIAITLLSDLISAGMRPQQLHLSLQEYHRHGAITAHVALINEATKRVNLIRKTARETNAARNALQMTFENERGNPFSFFPQVLLPLMQEYVGPRTEPELPDIDLLPVQRM